MMAYQLVLIKVQLAVDFVQSLVLSWAHLDLLVEEPLFLVVVGTDRLLSFV